MNLLYELLRLSESTEVTLLGTKVERKIVNEKTKDKVWSGNFPIRLKITTLKYSPKEVTGYFHCITGGITSLEYSPIKIGKCSWGSSLDFSNNKITSLEHCPKEIDGSIRMENCQLTSLKDIHKKILHMNGTLNLRGNPIKSNILGVLLIKGCTKFMCFSKDTGYPITSGIDFIINKYLPNIRGNKAVIDCQSELLDADLDDFAEL